MKFSRREDIEAPLEFVFREMTDFAALTRAAMRRGAEVKRTDSLGSPGVGMSWAIRAIIRGRTRDIAVRLTKFDLNQTTHCAVDSGGMLGTFSVEFVEIARGRTRINVALELRAATMTSRLILQSARLAKSTLDRRFARRITNLSREIEQRYAAEQHRS